MTDTILNNSERARDQVELGGKLLSWKNELLHGVNREICRLKNINVDDQWN